MDSRNTLKCNATFIDILSNCMEAKTKVAMLLDNNGLIRAEGLIKSIDLIAEKPYMEMQDGLKIALETITAVNGIFAASYSEC
ncbi:MAG: hypothetical protein JNK14_06870 [Chitinophagaceae bacterium]|nr:hypothetical protein [Chitinophagaceae bacterium]